MVQLNSSQLSLPPVTRMTLPERSAIVFTSKSFMTPTDLKAEVGQGMSWVTGSIRGGDGIDGDIGGMLHKDGTSRASLRMNEYLTLLHHDCFLLVFTLCYVI